MTHEQNSVEPFILFELAGTAYAVRSRAVQQIEMVEHVTPVPNATQAVDGVVLIRGQVVPALNLRARFGMERVPYDLRTRLIVVNALDRVVGLVVDAAREFLKIAEEAIKPPPETITQLSGHYLEGIVALNGRVVLVLDIEKVIDFATQAEKSEQAEAVTTI